MSHIAKPIGVVSCCVTVGIVVVLMVREFIPVKQDYNGGFNRIFLKNFLQERKISDIKFNSYYFAEVSSERIYLGNITAPSHLLSVSPTLDDTAFLKLKFPEGYKLAKAALQIKIESPDVYASETITPAILKGTLTDRKMKYFSLEQNSFLSYPVVLSNCCMAVKTYDSVKHKSILKKIDLNYPSFSIDSDILDKQIDGLFCTDGMLLYDNRSDRLIYVYYYRNTFIRLDTNLNIIYRARTIDTVSRAHIQVAKIVTDNSYTLSAPPVIVNRKGYLFRGYLFVNSAIRADNEIGVIFNHSAVIDVYTSNEGRYCFSFYLPEGEEGKIKYFAITDRAFLTIQNHYLVSYSIHWP